MAELLPIIMDMLKRPETNKVLSTVSPKGKPHTIVCGSLIVKDPSTILVGQVYMYHTFINLDSNSDVEFLVWSGAQAYSIQATFKCRYDSGPDLERMKQLLDKMHMNPIAVLVFTVNSAYDEGITPKSGSQVL